MTLGHLHGTRGHGWPPSSSSWAQSTPKSRGWGGNCCCSSTLTLLVQKGTRTSVIARRCCRAQGLCAHYTELPGGLPTAEDGGGTISVCPCHAWKKKYSLQTEYQLSKGRMSCMSWLSDVHVCSYYQLKLEVVQSRQSFTLCAVIVQWHSFGKEGRWETVTSRESTVCFRKLWCSHYLSD